MGDETSAAVAEGLVQVTSTLFGSDGAVPSVFEWITSSSVLPFFAVGIGCSLVLFGIKVVRSIVWGA